MNSYIPTLTYYWPLSDPQPSSERWRTWKKNFLDDPFQRTKKVEITSFQLGIVGRRYFDALKLDERKSLGAALLELDSIWDQPQNLFLQRYKFQQLRQQDDETVDQFINRLRLAVQDCEYNTVPAEKYDEMSLIQTLIVGTKDRKTSETLLTESSHLFGARDAY